VSRLGRTLHRLPTALSFVATLRETLREVAKASEHSASIETSIQREEVRRRCVVDVRVYRHQHRPGFAQNLTRVILLELLSTVRAILYWLTKHVLVEQRVRARLGANTT
jgi:hypothetical protein